MGKSNKKAKKKLVILAAILINCFTSNIVFADEVRPDSSQADNNDVGFNIRKSLWDSIRVSLNEKGNLSKQMNQLLDQMVKIVTESNCPQNSAINNCLSGEKLEKYVAMGLKVKMISRLIQLQEDYINRLSVISSLYYANENYQKALTDYYKSGRIEDQPEKLEEVFKASQRTVKSKQEPVDLQIYYITTLSSLGILDKNPQLPSKIQKRD